MEEMSIPEEVLAEIGVDDWELDELWADEWLEYWAELGGLETDYDY